jgi:hypothetical protein
LQPSLEEEMRQGLPQFEPQGGDGEQCDGEDGDENDGEDALMLPSGGSNERKTAKEKRKANERKKEVKKNEELIVLSSQETPSRSCLLYCSFCTCYRKKVHKVYVKKKRKRMRCLGECTIELYFHMRVIVVNLQWFCFRVKSIKKLLKKDDEKKKQRQEKKQKKTIEASSRPQRLGRQKYPFFNHLSSFFNSNLQHL